MNLGDIKLSEISQTQKERYCVLSQSVESKNFQLRQRESTMGAHQRQESGGLQG
jgi:hypothetical protein